MQLLSFAQCVSQSYQPRAALRLVYFGSDHYSLVHLQALKARENSCNDCRIQHVVTANDQTPVATYCAQVGLNYTTWPHNRNDCAHQISSRVKDWQSESDPVLTSVLSRSDLLGLVISFGRFLPPTLIRAFNKGCVNIHPSLLPRWRGPCPLLHTLLAGDLVSGVTAIQLPTYENTFDTGPVLTQHAVQLNWNQQMTTAQLGDFLSQYSIKVMFKIIDHALTNDFEGGVPQSVIANQTRLIPTNAPRPKESMGYVDWVNQSASDIVRFWHCFQGTSVSLSTSMCLSTSKQSLQDAQIRFVGKPPVAVLPSTALEPLDCETSHSLVEAASLLQQIPPSFPIGGLVYLRSQCQRKFPLIPYAFVACKSSTWSATHSWLAIPTLHLRVSNSSHFRPITALDFYNGFLCESESRQLSLQYRLPHGFHPFHGFRSLSNPLLSLPEYREPLRDLTILSLVNNSSISCPHKSVHSEKNRL